MVVLVLVENCNCNENAGIRIQIEKIKKVYREEKQNRFIGRNAKLIYT